MLTVLESIRTFALSIIKNRKAKAIIVFRILFTALFCLTAQNCITDQINNINFH